MKKNQKIVFFSVVAILIWMGVDAIFQNLSASLLTYASNLKSFNILLAVFEGFNSLAFYGLIVTFLLMIFKKKISSLNRISDTLLTVLLIICGSIIILFGGLGTMIAILTSKQEFGFKIVGLFMTLFRITLGTMIILIPFVIKDDDGTLKISCPHCSVKNDVESRFCIGCGQKIK